MTQISTEQRELIDLFDAYLQLLLAMSWQNMQNDGLAQLRVLGKQVSDRVAAQGAVFPTEARRKAAHQRILLRLQRANREGQWTFPLIRDNWTRLPAPELRLAEVHPGRTDMLAGLFEQGVQLAARQLYQARMSDPQVQRQVEYWVRQAALRLDFPLHIPLLANGVMSCVTQARGYPGAEAQQRMLARYTRYAEQFFQQDLEHGACYAIVDALWPQARTIDMAIGQLYGWDDLARFAGESTLKALKHYSLLNWSGKIKSAHFSAALLGEDMGKIDRKMFDQLMTPGYVKGLTLMMAPRDLRHPLRSDLIVDTRSRRLHVDGAEVDNAMVLIVPFKQQNLDLEKLVAQFLNRVGRQLPPSSYSDGDGALLPGARLPKRLHDLVRELSFERKILKSKNSILPLLAGLAAENIFAYRASTPERRAARDKVVKVQHALDLAARELRDLGFDYSVNSIEKARKLVRTTYLKRLPALLGLTLPA